MAVTDWKTCGTCANDTGVGTLGWIQYDPSGFVNNPISGAEVSADDATFGTGSANAAGNTWATGGISNYLKCTMGSNAFNTSDIPSGATIDGFEVEIRKARNSGTPAIAQTNLKFVKGGTISGSDFSSQTDWATSETADSFGSSTEKGGLSWTDSDARASNFGVALWYECTTRRLGIPAGSWSFVDQVRIRVYYTVGASRNPGGDMMPFFS